MRIGEITRGLALAFTLQSSAVMSQSQVTVPSRVNTTLEGTGSSTLEVISHTNCNKKRIDIVFSSDNTPEEDHELREMMKNPEGVMKNIEAEYFCIINKINARTNNASSEEGEREFSQLESVTRVAESYGMDISDWQKQITELFPPETQRPWNQKHMRRYSEHIVKYSNGSEEERSMAFMFIYQDFESVTYYRDKLISLGANKQEVDGSLREIFIKFIPRFLHDLLEIIGYDIKGKYPLNAFYPSFGPSNPYSRWKEQFESSLKELSPIDPKIHTSYLAIYKSLSFYIDAREKTVKDSIAADEKSLRDLIDNKK